MIATASSLVSTLPRGGNSGSGEEDSPALHKANGAQEPGSKSQGPGNRSQGPGNGSQGPRTRESGRTRRHRLSCISCITA